MASSISPILAHFTVPLPPSVNCLYDGGKKVKQRFKSDAYTKWCAHARQFTNSFKQDYKSANGGWWEVMCQPVGMMYRYGHIDDKRDRDLENYIKAISDLLVDEMFIRDDSLIHKNYQEWADDVQPRYVEVVMIVASKMVVTIG